MSERIWPSKPQVMMDKEFARENGRKIYGGYRQIRHLPLPEALVVVERRAMLELVAMMRGFGFGTILLFAPWRPLQGFFDSD